MGREQPEQARTRVILKQIITVKPVKTLKATYESESPKDERIVLLSDFDGLPD
jgi:hypothetical protein